MFWFRLYMKQQFFFIIIGKNGYQIYTVWTLPVFLPFPKSTMQNGLHSYDILMIKIKADPSQAWFCWVQ